MENFTLNDYRKMLDDKLNHISEIYNKTKDYVEIAKNWISELEGQERKCFTDDEFLNDIIFDFSMSIDYSTAYYKDKQIYNWLCQVRELRKSKNMNQESSETNM